MSIPTLQSYLRKGPADRLAAAASTTVAYLYQLAGGHRRASAEMAIALEVASRKVRARDGKAPTLRRQALAPHINWRRMAPRK